jgi:hypothetical protein
LGGWLNSRQHGGLTMPLTPWDYATKTGKEHAEQVALFMWAAMVRRYGLQIANDPACYIVKGLAEKRSLELGGDAYALPQLKWLHAIHNQRDGNNVVAGARAKAEGVKAGVSDMFLPVVGENIAGDYNWIVGVSGKRFCAGLYIELKRKDASNSTPSKEQLEFQTDMQAAGYKVEICHGWEAARDCILAYLGISNAG